MKLAIDYIDLMILEYVEHRDILSHLNKVIINKRIHWALGQGFVFQKCCVLYSKKLIVSDNLSVKCQLCVLLQNLGGKSCKDAYVRKIDAKFKKKLFILLIFEQVRIKRLVNSIMNSADFVISLCEVEYSVLGDTARWSRSVPPDNPQQPMLQPEQLSNTSLKMVKMDNNVKSPAKRPYLRYCIVYTVK